MNIQHNLHLLRSLPLPVHSNIRMNVQLSRSFVSLSTKSSTTIVSVIRSRPQILYPNHPYVTHREIKNNQYKNSVYSIPLSTRYGISYRLLSTVLSGPTTYPLSSYTSSSSSTFQSSVVVSVPKNRPLLRMNYRMNRLSRYGFPYTYYPRSFISTYMNISSLTSTLYTLYHQYILSYFTHHQSTTDPQHTISLFFLNIFSSVSTLNDKPENHFVLQSNNDNKSKNKYTDALVTVPNNNHQDPQPLENSQRSSSDAVNNDTDENMEGGTTKETDPSSESSSNHSTDTKGNEDKANSSTTPSPPPSLLQRLWFIVKTQIGWIVTAATLSIIAAWLGIITPQTMAKFWDQLEKKSFTSSSSSSSSTTDTAVTTTGALIGSGLRLVTLLVTRFALQLAATVTLADATERVANHLRRQLFSHFLRTDIAYFDNHRTAELVDSLSVDVKEVRDSIRSIIGDGVPALAKVIGGAVSLLFISPKMTALLITTFVPAFAIGNLLANRLRKLARKSTEAQSKSSASAAESLSHIRTVRAFTGEKDELDKYTSHLNYASSVSHAMGIEYSLFRGIVSLGLTVIAGLVLGYGGILIGNGELTRGEVASFALSALSLENALETLSKLGAKLQRAQGATGRVVELLDEPVQANREGGVTWEHLKGDVMYEDVRFAYPTRPHVPVLKGLSMHLPPGKVVAVVGPSGTGKSTLAHLLLRYYEPSLASTINKDLPFHSFSHPSSPPSMGSSTTGNPSATIHTSSKGSNVSPSVLDNHAGMIRIDGIPLALINIHWLRKHIAIVPQDPALFATTIKENIAYGRPEATDADIERVAKEANALQFIQALPHGMNTLVGERGVSLSGGEKQRITLARALLRNPSILILDEATSALDVQSEQLVQEALDRAMVGRTTLIIAHRLSTIRRADIIYVVSDGRIEEKGTHEELLRTRPHGLYAGLVARQRDGGEEVLRP